MRFLLTLAVLAALRALCSDAFFYSERNRISFVQRNSLAVPPRAFLAATRGGATVLATEESDEEETDDEEEEEESDDEEEEEESDEEDEEEDSGLAAVDEDEEDDDEEESDSDEEDDFVVLDDEESEDEEEEEEEEEDEMVSKLAAAKLASSTVKSSYKAKSKKAATKKASVKQVFKSKLAESKPVVPKKKKKGLLRFLRLPYIIRACLNPFTAAAMTRAYWASLFSLDFPKKTDSSQELRSALEEKAKKPGNNKRGGNRGKRKMKRGQAKTLSDLPKLNT